ncbi:MAG: fasciclin domain-containing protein [Bacteroidia bacterium]|nr:fasciclin domain-containing protein [Bacteroidia bacterium]
MKTRIASILFGLLSIALFAQSPVQAHGHEKGKKDIVTVAVEAGNFTTLAKALTATGLVDALKGKGPFTVFAPTDEAFAKLPKGTLESLLKDTEALKNILLYHVVSGSVTSSEVVKLKNATTLSGQSVMISVKGDKVMIDKSSVTAVDIAASNGVIHVIDQVLIPATK